MSESLLGALLVIVILIAGAVVTQWFAKHMYNTCPRCGILNAKRRSHCRGCGQPLEDS